MDLIFSWYLERISQFQFIVPVTAWCQDILILSSLFNFLLILFLANLTFTLQHFNPLLNPKAQKGTEFLSQKFLITISLQPDVVHLLYFKLRLFYLTEFVFGNIKALRNRLNSIKRCHIGYRVPGLIEVLHTKMLTLLKVSNFPYIYWG